MDKNSAKSHLRAIFGLFGPTWPVRTFSIKIEICQLPYFTAFYFDANNQKKKTDEPVVRSC